MLTATRPTTPGTMGEKALEAAYRAWEICGEQVEVRSTSTDGSNAVTSLMAPDAKRVEFVIEDDLPEVWEALTQLHPFDAWQLCALVPQALLGVAHDRLRGHSFELQGWWLDGDRVSFGNPEIA